MFENLTAQENDKLWNKMISASEKTRKLMDYILDLPGYGSNNLLVMEFNSHLDAENDILDIQDELTAAISKA